MWSSLDNGVPVNEIGRMTLSEDRLLLQQCWYDQGFFGRESITELLERGAREFPDTYMHFVGGPTPVSISLAEMFEQSLQLAAGLTSLGIKAGDVIAIWVPNWVEGALTYQAALMLGATVVPIIHIYGAREVGFILRESRARVLVMPDRWRNIDYVERFKNITAIPDLDHVVCIGKSGPRGAMQWSHLADFPQAVSLPKTHPDDVCILIYTSGTTAEPKGVQHSTNTLVSEVKSTAAALGEGTGVYLAAFPAGHIAGVLGLLRMFLLGTTSIVMDQWDPALAARLIAQYRVTSTSGAPYFLMSLMDEASKNSIDISSITHYMVGAASVPRSLVERADALGIPVYRAYGSTEHPVITTGCPSDPLIKRAGTDGLLTPGNEIRLLDENDHDVGIGNDGEIVSRGPELFLGYRDNTLNETSFLPGGWFRTGDIGRLDVDGFLTITDRKKDIIIRGGENIASKEIEDLLIQHPHVADAAAIAKPDERFGERIAVFVQTMPGLTIDLAEIIAHFEPLGVARQKTPEYLQIVDALPRSLSGKVRKVELRDQLRLLK